MPQWCMQEVFRAVLYAELDFTRPPWDTVSAECRQLVQSLLQRNPADRPTAAQALNHRYPAPLPPPSCISSTAHDVIGTCRAHLTERAQLLACSSGMHDSCTTFNEPSLVR